MYTLEQWMIEGLLQFTTHEALNDFLHDPRTVALIIGGLIAISGALLGSFLLLRRMSLTTDAISHTILLGIVVAFLVLTAALGQEADLSSPWLIIGAALAGVGTVILTELIQRSGLVRQDAALGLAFPFLFAVAVILISRYVDNAHLDEDAVIVGEIGVAWANTNSHCFEHCESVSITPDDPRATVGRECVNCAALGISPRDPAAQFQEICSNCGEYSAAQAYSQGLIDAQPVLVFFPKAISIMGLITLINLLFVLLCYKELKLSSFDAALAATLGFRPGLLTYLLMILVSVTAVGAFDAVGAVLVVAFFIIPPATAYLLTDRLSLMLLLSPMIGVLGTYSGYDFAQGNFLGLFQVSRLLELLDPVLGLDGYTVWNTRISAAMVLMLLVFFLVAWVLSPRYGLISGYLRRWVQRRHFLDQIMLGHIYHHQGTQRSAEELAVASLHEHFQWSQRETQQVLRRLRARQWVEVQAGRVGLTAAGENAMRQFVRQHIPGARIA